MTSQRLVQFLRRIAVPAVGVAFSVAVMVTFVAFHRSALRSGFQTMCRDDIHAIEQHLETNLDLLRSVQAFAQQSPSNDWDSMHRFVENFSLLAKDVARYYWWNPDIAPALVQPLEAYPEDSTRVSFNAAAIHPLITRSLQNDAPAAMFIAPRSLGEHPLYVVALAVSHPGRFGAAATRPVEGVLLAFDTQKLIEEALSINSSRGVQLTIRDRNGNLLFGGAPIPSNGAYFGRLFEPAPRQWSYPARIAFADTPWSVEGLPTGRFPGTDSLACWGVLGFGLLLTTLVDSIVETRRREADAMRGAMRLRARQLNETRDRLQMEIAGKESAEALLRESEDRFRKAYADAAVGIIMSDLEGRLVAVNRSACRLAGFPEHRLIGASFIDLLADEDHRTDARRQIDLMVRRVEMSYHAERRIRREDGKCVWLRVSVSVIESDGKPANFFALLEDITEQVESRRQLEFHANHDALTSLLNRRAFESRLACAIERAAARNTPLALLYIDLDGFKFVNDSLGHAVGDILLRKVAPRLGKCLTSDEVLARVGGDEFTLVLEAPDAAEFAARTHRILLSLHEPFEVAGHELFVSASIGISLYPRDGDSPGALVQHADAAMYHAKREGRGRFCFFDVEMAVAAAARLRMESDLRRALANNEIHLHFQPLVNAHDGAVNGFEALCRWRREGGESVPPSRFVPVAEESGLIIPIGSWVLEEACRQADRWNRVASRQVRVAVNVSFVQLAQGNFAADVRKALEITGLAPSLLELELTESAVMRDPEQTLETLKELRGMGVSLALDDFGTGYSSLSHLQGIPLEAVKIDQSFISRMTESRRSAQLVASLIALAHGMGLKVVAEGVESAEQAAALRSLACDVLQGYLLGGPADATAALRLIERGAGESREKEMDSLAALALVTQNHLTAPWQLGRITEKIRETAA